MRFGAMWDSDLDKRSTSIKPSNIKKIIKSKNDGWQQYRITLTAWNNKPDRYRFNACKQELSIKHIHFFVSYKKHLNKGSRSGTYYLLFHIVIMFVYIPYRALILELPAGIMLFWDAICSYVHWGSYISPHSFIFRKVYNRTYIKKGLQFHCDFTHVFLHLLLEFEICHHEQFKNAGLAAHDILMIISWSD